MKRLSKMAYELRDVTIFYEKHVNQYSTRFIAGTHNRSTSRICQILKKQWIRYGFYEKMNSQYWIKPMTEKYIMQRFYYFEIDCILQRYYIRIKNEN